MPPKLNLRLLVCIAVLAPLSAIPAELWTNQARQVIVGTVDSCDGGWVTLRKTNGTTLRIPLSGLCEKDQRRVRLQKGLPIAPDFIKAAYNDARAVMLRFESLPPYQRTTKGRTKALLMAYSVFDARVGPRTAKITDKAVLEEVKRLRSLLAGDETK